MSVCMYVCVYVCMYVYLHCTIRESTTADDVDMIRDLLKKPRKHNNLIVDVITAHNASVIRMH